MIRGDKRRQALSASVRKQIVPVLKQLGFESTKIAAWRRLSIKDYGFGYARLRDGYPDLVDIHWDKHGRARFAIEFTSEQPGRMPVDHNRVIPMTKNGRTYPGNSTLLRRLLGIEGYWFGQRETIQRTVELAVERLGEVDLFLREGVLSRNIRII